MPSLRRLLIINSSSRLTRSLTRQLTGYAAGLWQAKFPAGSVEHMDVGLNPIPAVDQDWIAAAYTPAAERSQQMQSALAFSDLLIDQLVQADAIALGVPHYNFGIPATLKGYFEQVVRVGRTFGFRSGNTEQPYVGLLADRPVLVATASGAPGTEPGGFNHHLNFVEPQLVATLGLIGLNSVKFARVSHQQGNHAQVASSVCRAKHVIDDWIESIQFLR